ncbi:MAG TPA: alkaline phosphatase, partial [Fibrobacteraceae bacterium]|nr:alkaline phosphatase [Fibrobacteraceae bacterium]
MRNLACFLCCLGLASGAWATVPRNIILMIGDGCGAKQFQAINAYRMGKDSSILNSFPVQLWMSTYSVEGAYSPDSAAADALYVTRKPTDSAASSTAFSTGKKTYDAAIGVGQDSLPLLTVVESASLAGKSTGVV